MDMIRKKVIFGRIIQKERSDFQPCRWKKELSFGCNARLRQVRLWRERVGVGKSTSQPDRQICISCGFCLFMDGIHNKKEDKIQPMHDYILTYIHIYIIYINIYIIYGVDSSANGSHRVLVGGVRGPRTANYQILVYTTGIRTVNVCSDLPQHLNCYSLIWMNRKLKFNLSLK